MLEYLKDEMMRRNAVDMSEAEQKEWKDEWKLLARPDGVFTSPPYSPVIHRQEPALPVP